MSHNTSACSTTNPTASADACAGAGETGVQSFKHHGAIGHVDFTVPDLQRAKDFYGSLFQWEFYPMSEREWYFMSPKGGPCGCILKGEADTAAKTVFYVCVDDIPTTIAQATTLGAKVVLPWTEIPGGHGFIAKLGAPEGNTVALYCSH